MAVLREGLQWAIAPPPPNLIFSLPVLLPYFFSLSPSGGATGGSAGHWLAQFSVCYRVIVYLILLMYIFFSPHHFQIKTLYIFNVGPTSAHPVLIS